MFRILLPAALLVTGSAALSADRASDRPSARDEVRLARVLDGLTPGEPRSCINPRRITDTTRVGTRIIYSFSRREKYVTDTGGGCFGLDRGDAIISNSPSGFYCRGDIIRTQDLPARIPTGSCTFGDFVPYTGPARTR